MVVVSGLNAPQFDPPHVTAQRASGFADTSLLIAARRLIGALTCMDAGVAPKKDTVMAIGGTMVMAAELDRDVSATEVAFTVTVPPAGTALGAV